MKKINAILGSIMGIVGMIMFFFAQSEIASNGRYTWEKPYTEFEVQVLSCRLIGILFIIMGVIDVALFIAQRIYINKTVQEIDSFQTSVMLCPKCGLRISENTRICPKCKNEM